MSAFVAIAHLVAEGAHDPTKTPSAIWPEGYEMLFGIPASIIVFALLYKFAGPLVKKSMKDRTAKIQAELDSGSADRTSAEAEAASIRQAKGDIAAERARIDADAEAQAAALLSDGRARLQQELAELEARSNAEIASAAGRTGDELRAEISRLSAAAVDHVVSGSLDAATQQTLIEDFINRVGASA